MRKWQTEGPPVIPPIQAPAGANAAAVSGSRLGTLVNQLRRLVRAIGEGDDATVEAAVLQLSSRHRVFAPLGIVVGGFAMLFEGLRLVFANWRLTLIQLLPAMWIWAAMMDFKGHVFHGRTFHPLHGSVLLAAILAVAAITAASFFLNAVFAFAIARPGGPGIRPGFRQARSHGAVVVGWGAVIGLLLGVAALYADRWGRHWFVISMSAVLAIMMVAYVSVPARLIGMKTTYSASDKLKASVVAGAVGAVVCSPPYALGRVGILMLGSRLLWIPGIFVVALGFTLQAGATSAVKAVKMSAKLVAGHELSGPGDPAAPAT
jgi:hypothetical protein